MMGSLEISFIIFGIIQFSIASSICPGCSFEQDINDPTTHTFLRTVLSNYKSPPMGFRNENTELIKINKATRQIVNGVKYSYEFDVKGIKTHNIYKCQLSTLSQPWDEGYKILSYDCRQESLPRIKRAVLGGETEIDVSDTHLLELKDSIEEALTSQLKTDYSMKIIKFIKASQQIVAGIKTSTAVEVVKTDCKSDDSKCTTLSKDHQFCNIEIWEKPWLNFKEIKVKDCNTIPYYCPGCLKELSADDEQANQCLKRTLYNLNTKAHAHKQLKLIKVNKVQSQVVAGLKFIIDFEVEDQSKSHYLCRSAIVSQPWISPEPLVDEFSCNLIKT